MPVAARFHETRDRIAAGIDQRFGEPVRLTFLKDGAVDPNRAPVEIDAVLRAGGGKETNIAGGSAGSWRTQLAAGKAELHINRATYVGPQPEAGDKVWALSRHGEPGWEVLRVDDRGEVRLILELGEI